MSDASWAGRTVLVTGATGIVGSWLVRALLVRGARVVALIRDQDPRSDLFRSGLSSDISVISGPLEEFSVCERAINKHEVDTVFHLGAQPIVGVADRFPLATFESNIRGTYNVLEACRIHPSLVETIVIASSDKAYGPSDLPYVEDMPLRGRHPYEVSKSCADLLATSYHDHYGLPVSIARCANIYGGGDLNWSRIVPGTIRSFLQDERPVLRSDGTFTRDYIYVEDVVSAYLTLAEGMDSAEIRGQAFNFTAGVHLTVLDVVSNVADVMGVRHLDADVRGGARGELPHQALDGAKARDVLGWKAKVGLTEALQRTVAWYREYLA